MQPQSYILVKRLTKKKTARYLMEDNGNYYENKAKSQRMRQVILYSAVTEGQFNIE